ncbi:hypothetical protein HPB49_002839 [Dermacentor silvarum]|uniref:Uncharacterized protein n=1 Tax=Dermacentor silvarum TaxID=543639 RepID=A0ACB8CPC4_DERSI|nr:hypothetical protein HPB49_002839 [Dermacentor silvarum]
MDEQFIRLDRLITRHVSAHLSLSEGDPMPEFSVRYLSQSNQLAVDAAEPEVRNALLAIAYLSIRGQDVPFHSYEAVGHNQIRGIFTNAEDMSSQELIPCIAQLVLGVRPLHPTYASCPGHHTAGTLAFFSPDLGLPGPHISRPCHRALTSTALVPPGPGGTTGRDRLRYSHKSHAAPT